jgi:hypothetical protein
VLTLSLPVFEELTRTVPGYGLAIATVFARRLEGFIKRMRGKKRREGPVALASVQSLDVQQVPERLSGSVQ